MEFKAKKTTGSRLGWLTEGNLSYFSKVGLSFVVFVKITIVLWLGKKEVAILWMYKYIVIKNVISMLYYKSSQYDETKGMGGKQGLAQKGEKGLSPPIRKKNVFNLPFLEGVKNAQIVRGMIC